MKPKKTGQGGKKPTGIPEKSLTEKKRVFVKEIHWHLLLLTALVSILFWELTFEQRIYPTGDTINDAVLYEQVRQYHDKTGEVALWNPFVFGGIPNIFHLPKNAIVLDYYLDLLSQWLSLPFVFFLLGGLGMYLFLKKLNFTGQQALFGAIIFLIAPYYKSLVIVGHLTKVQAIMYVPWILWALRSVLTSPKWRYVLFLILAAGMQIRTSHYQIVFYTAIIAFLLVLAHWIRSFRTEKRIPVKLTGFLFVAALGCLFIAARPLWLAKQYAGDSVRGREIVRLNSEGEQPQERGVSKSFVQVWSFKPRELTSLLLPRGQGGTSDEKHDHPQIRQNSVPGYWGHSPYNGSYYYLGSLVFLLGLLGFNYLKRENWILPFGLSLVLMLVWSLGTFAGPLFDVSYLIVPFFSNFRTPTTSLSMVYLIGAVMATYGLKWLTESDSARQVKLRRMIVLASGTILLLFLLGMTFSFEKSGEDIPANSLDLIIEVRRQMYFQDLGWFVIMTAILIAIVYGIYRWGWTTRFVIPILIFCTVIDLGRTWLAYSEKTVPIREFNRAYLGNTQTTQYLKNDGSVFRTFILGQQNFGLPAHLQSIGGGYDMQMNKGIYELANNSFYQKLDGTNQINWNVLDFMNVKYVVTDRQLNSERLNLELNDAGTGLNTYRYRFAKDRGFFVDQIQVIRDPKARLQAINSPTFDARRTAILSEPLEVEISEASRAAAQLISFDPNKVTYTVETDRQGLFVMSEVYHPALQSVWIDGSPAGKVYQTNHTIQSVVVPPGLHTIEIRYNGRLFSLTNWISSGGFIVIYLLLIWTWRQEGHLQRIFSRDSHSSRVT